MGQPTWRQIKKLMVPEREAGLWTPALDYVSTGKLYRILVETQVDTAPAQPQPAAAQVGADVAADADGGAAMPVAAQANGAPPPPAAADAAEHPPAGPIEPAVPRDQQWTPEAGTPCTADGDPSLERKDGGLVIETCAAGALIAKIGGSTADIKPDTNKATMFGVNDTKGSIRRLQGQLEVTIFEAL
jgi:hypothetical protein